MQTEVWVSILLNTSLFSLFVIFLGGLWWISLFLGRLLVCMLFHFWSCLLEFLFPRPTNIRSKWHLSISPQKLSHGSQGIVLISVTFTMCMWVCVPNCERVLDTKILRIHNSAKKMSLHSHLLSFLVSLTSIFFHYAQNSEFCVYFNM